MKQFKLLQLGISAIIAASLLNPHAYAGNEGGGGGLIVVNGQLSLVTEGHLKVKSAQDYTLPNYYILNEKPLELVDEILRLSKISAKMKEVLSRAIKGNSQQYFSVQTIDPALSSKIRADYASVANKFGLSLPAHAIMLAAVSDAKNTYILPAFSQLNDLQQAKILIHEGVYRYISRVKGNSIGENELREVLAIDTLVEQVTSNQINDLGRLELSNLLGSVFGQTASHRYPPDYQRWTPGHQKFLTFAALKELLKRPLLLTEVAIQDWSIHDWPRSTDIENKKLFVDGTRGGSLHLDPVLVQKIVGNSPLIRAHLNGMRIPFKWDPSPFMSNVKSQSVKAILTARNSYIDAVCRSLSFNPGSEFFFHVDDSKEKLFLINCATQDALTVPEVSNIQEFLY